MITRPPPPILAGLAAAAATAVVWILLGQTALPGADVARLDSLRRQIWPHPAIARASGAGVDVLARTLCSSPAAFEAQEVQSRLRQSSALARVKLVRMDAAPAASAPLSGLTAVRLVLGVRGAEPNLMAFLAAAASSSPPLVFDQVTIGRSAPAAGLQLDLQARLICAAD